jgi:hypothetical protein
MNTIKGTNKICKAVYVLHRAYIDNLDIREKVKNK